MLDYCTQFAKERHFHWGTQKCEVLQARIPPTSPPLILQNEPLKISKTFKYLGIHFDNKGLDVNACVDRIGKSMERAAEALSAIGLQPRNYPLHIIANHFRVFVRSCGEYALAILPLREPHIAKLERHQYRAVKSLLKIRGCIPRVKLVTCMGLETVRLRYNLLTAKWFHGVISHKGPDFLVKQALLDFTKRYQTQSVYAPVLVVLLLPCCKEPHDSNLP